MDSWETVRHNLSGVDTMTFKLKKPSSVRYLLLSTKYHTGNFSPIVKLEGKVQGLWKEFLPQTHLQGHSELRITLPQETEVMTDIRASIYPDGGFTRLGLFKELPMDEIKTFDGISREYAEKVPATVKPLNIEYKITKEEIEKNWKAVEGEIDLACSALGAKIISATDEHYAPASHVLSPFAPINMFDGMESARSRKPGHFEELVIELARPGKIHRFEMDFSYFVNNNPLEVSIDGLSDGMWVAIIPKSHVKAFRGNKKVFEYSGSNVFTQLRIKTFPCGGMNRFKALTK